MLGLCLFAPQSLQAEVFYWVSALLCSQLRLSPGKRFLLVVGGNRVIPGGSLLQRWQLVPWLLLSLHALLCRLSLSWVLALHPWTQASQDPSSSRNKLPSKALSGLFLPGAAQLLLQG